MHAAATHTGPYGLMAEFDDPDAVVEAARKAHAAGYRVMDAFSPMPVEGLAEAMGFERNRVAPIVFVGGLLGLLTAFGLQYYTAVIDYPVNIAGRPYNSWPSFVPIMFELTVLFASLTAVFGMLGMNGLPRLYHPVFNAEPFARKGADDGFFLCIQADDPKFDLAGTRQFLEGLAPKSLTEVEP